MPKCVKNIWYYQGQELHFSLNVGHEIRILNKLYFAMHNKQAKNKQKVVILSHNLSQSMWHDYV